MVKSYALTCESQALRCFLSKPTTTLFRNYLSVNLSQVKTICVIHFIFPLCLQWSWCRNSLYSLESTSMDCETNVWNFELSQSVLGKPWYILIFYGYSCMDFDHLSWRNCVTLSPPFPPPTHTQVWWRRAQLIRPLRYGMSPVYMLRIQIQRWLKQEVSKEADRCRIVCFSPMWFSLSCLLYSPPRSLSPWLSPRILNLLCTSLISDSPHTPNGYQFHTCAKLSYQTRFIRVLRIYFTLFWYDGFIPVLQKISGNRQDLCRFCPLLFSSVLLRTFVLLILYH